MHSKFYVLILAFYYNYIVRFWKQIGVLHLKRIPMFVIRCSWRFNLSQLATDIETVQYLLRTVKKSRDIR